MRYYVAVLHRHGDHLAEHQPLVIEGKAVPGTLDMTAPKYQEQECQHDTAASKEKEQLLPAPETLPAQDQKCAEADIDQQTDNQNPPLRGATKHGEHCPQIIA